MLCGRIALWLHALGTALDTASRCPRCADRLKRRAVRLIGRTLHFGG